MIFRMGHLLAITVHAANIHDTVGGVDVYDKVVELPFYSRYVRRHGISGDICFACEQLGKKMRYNGTNQAE